jgi:hypothetical protein
MSERRAHARRKLVLPVRLKIADDLQFAHTIDITCGGVRIGNVRSELEIGKVVTLSRGPHKAKFRVAWVQQIGPKEMQAGLEALQQDDALLGVDISENQGNSSDEILLTLLKLKQGELKDNSSRKP